MKRIVSPTAQTFAAALASALLVLALPTPAAAQSLPFQNVSKGELGPSNATLGRQVFRDAASLSQAGLDGLVPSGFDFQQQMLIAVLNQGSDMPSIQSIERRILPGGGPPGAAGGQLQLVVSVATQTLPPSMATVVRRPYHLVSLQRAAGQVLFVDVAAQRFRNVAGGSQAAPVLPGNYVIRTQQELSALRLQSLIPVGASIDFSQEMLLAVVSAAKPSGGYSLSIEDVQARAAGFAGVVQEHLEVRFRERAPSGIAVTVVTQPYHIVAVPRSARMVVFKPALPAPAPVVFYPYTSGINAPQALASGQHALRSEQALRAAGAQSLIPVGGSFDFSGEMLLAAVMDQKTSGGYATQVASITREFDPATETSFLRVVIAERGPGSGMVTMALTRPYAVVRMPQSLEPIRFEVQSAPAPTPAPPTPDPADSLRGRVSLGVSFGVSAVLLEVNGARLYVQPQSFADSLRPLVGEQVLVRARRMGPIAFASGLLSPEPLAEKGRLYRDASGLLRFARSAGALTFPPLPALTPRGGFSGLVEQPELHGLELELKGYVFPDGGLVLSELQAWAKQDASLYDTSGQLAGGVVKGRRLELVAASSDGLFAEPKGLAGWIRLADLSFVEPSSIGITGALKKP